MNQIGWRRQEAFKVQKNKVPKKADFEFVSSTEEKVTDYKREEDNVTVHPYKREDGKVRKRRRKLNKNKIQKRREVKAIG